MSRPSEVVLATAHVPIVAIPVAQSVAKPVAQPVAKIVGAEAIAQTDTVTAARGALGQPQTSQVLVTATVTFAKLQAESFAYVPEAPQLIPPLPHDFFYPFTTNWD